MAAWTSSKINAKLPNDVSIGNVSVKQDTNMFQLEML
jgi:hypothetical protein